MTNLLPTLLDRDALVALVACDVSAASVYLVLVAHLGAGMERGWTGSVEGLRREIGELTGTTPGWQRVATALRKLESCGVIETRTAALSHRTFRRFVETPNRGNSESSNSTNRRGAQGFRGSVSGNRGSAPQQPARPIEEIRDRDKRDARMRTTSLRDVARARGNDGGAGDEPRHAKPLPPEVQDALSGLYSRLSAQPETAGKEEELRAAAKAKAEEVLAREAEEGKG